jgi:hypothetical protein
VADLVEENIGGAIEKVGDMLGSEIENVASVVAESSTQVSGAITDAVGEQITAIMQSAANNLEKMNAIINLLASLGVSSDDIIAELRRLGFDFVVGVVPPIVDAISNSANQISAAVAGISGGLGGLLRGQGSANAASREEIKQAILNSGVSTDSIIAQLRNMGFEVTEGTLGTPPQSPQLSGGPYAQPQSSPESIWERFQRLGSAGWADLYGELPEPSNPYIKEWIDEELVAADQAIIAAQIKANLKRTYAYLGTAFQSWFDLLTDQQIRLFSGFSGFGTAGLPPLPQSEITGPVIDMSPGGPNNPLPYWMTSQPQPGTVVGSIPPMRDYGQVAVQQGANNLMAGTLASQRPIEITINVQTADERVVAQRLVRELSNVGIRVN